jgi:hypothetical protein
VSRAAEAGLRAFRPARARRFTDQLSGHAGGPRRLLTGRLCRAAIRCRRGCAQLVGGCWVLRCCSLSSRWDGRRSVRSLAAGGRDRLSGKDASACHSG